MPRFAQHELEWRRAGLIVGAVLLLVMIDRLGGSAAVAAIDGYRTHVSPRISSVVRCRFQPTCSWYGRESIRRQGLLLGGARTTWRIARCGPWTKMGTVDWP